MSNAVTVRACAPTAVGSSVAEKLAQSNLLPPEFRGSPVNVAIAMDLAEKLDMSPFAVMQGLYRFPKTGQLAFKSTFALSLILGCGRFTQYDFEEEEDPKDIVKEVGGKPNRKMRVVAIRASDGKPCAGEWVSYRMAADDGWTRNEKWRTISGQMLRYRAAMFFARVWCPDLMNGLTDRTEAEDIELLREARAQAEPIRQARDPEPAETAEDDEEEVIGEWSDPEETPLADFRDKIAAARDLNELGLVGAEINRTDVGEAQKAELREIYLARKHELS